MEYMEYEFSQGEWFTANYLAWILNNPIHSGKNKKYMLLFSLKLERSFISMIHIIN